MKRIIREYCELYTKKLDNLDAMNEFLEAQNLQRLHHKQKI